MKQEAEITFFGQCVKVACDLKCKKAWGVNSRPRVYNGLAGEDFGDDWAYLSDSELGEAPSNPGTYEGSDGKPLSPAEFPNKWCVRECERCVISRPGESLEPLELQDFSKRVYNIAPF